MDGLLDVLLEWARQNLIPLGVPGLIAIAFAESSFFPVPPDVILIPLVLLDPKNAIFYGLLTTISSAVGALFGYWIGLRGGRPVLKKFANEKNIQKAESFFNKYGAWAVGIAALTPIPYKVFTIASGAFGMKNLRAFFLASFLGRGARFMSESILLMIFGEPILAFLKSSFEQITLIIGLSLAAILAIHTWLKKRTKVQDLRNLTILANRAGETSP